MILSFFLPLTITLVPFSNTVVPPSLLKMPKTSLSPLLASSYSSRGAAWVTLIFAKSLNVITPKALPYAVASIESSIEPNSQVLRFFSGAFSSIPVVKFTAPKALYSPAAILKLDTPEVLSSESFSVLL